MKAFGNITKDGQVRAVASGALTDGTAVIVNADGTVSVVGETSVSAGVGTKVVFENAATYRTSAVYDSNAQKVVIAYADYGGSLNGDGTAIVGTVSGTSISFGSPVTFSSDDAQQIATTFDSTNNKVVIAFRDGSNSSYGTAIVGTVSGTSISFGSATVYNSNITTHNSAAFDSNAGKVVIGFRNQTGSNLGKAIVGTVSGTSISFGSAVTFNNASTQRTAAVYDSNAQKVVISYRDLGDSNKGKSIVGTVSGTSISFGSAVEFNSNTNYIKSTYDSTNNKVIVVYSDGGNGDSGTAIVGTVSGTSISFGSEVVFHSGLVYESTVNYDSSTNKSVVAYRSSSTTSGKIRVGTVSGTSISFDSEAEFESNTVNELSGVYDSSEEKIVLAYRDAGNSSYGTAIVFRNSATSTNITSENFIGFSDGAYANTQSAAINTTNTIDRNQSGLTAGQTYFVQNDGTLGTTAADPSVTAGTAISATELIVKG
tara:strand:+ start:769 stop:2220 length:1452 start_codon:yes stop_codon:yes gene_type:complete